MPPAQNLKHRVFTCLTKLSDRDTHSLAASELESIARTLEPSCVPVFLSCIQSTDASDKSLVRKQCVHLITVLSESHGDSLSPHLSKMLSNITKRLRDPDSAVRSACQNAVASLSCHVTKPPFSSFLKPLTDALFTEQDPNSQIGSALCLASGIDAAPDPEPAKLARLLPRLERLMKYDGFKAKPAVLTLIGSVIGSGGASGQGALKSLVPCLVGFLSSEDWAARKAAAEALAKLAVVERDTLSEFKAGSLRTFENRKFDKVKGVREVMNQMVEVWKQIPDLSDEASPPPPSNASSKENASDGYHPAVSRNCDAPGSEVPKLKKKPILACRSTPPDSSYATTARKRSPLKSNDKKKNPGMFRKTDHKKPSDWDVEVAALSAPSSAGAFDDGLKERDEERKTNGNTRFSKPETKRALFHKSSDSKVHKFGGSRSGSRVAPCQEDTPDSTVIVSNVTEDIHKNHRECEDLSLIRSQLVQIEKQQSSLLDLVQRFMGSSQNGMRSLETRVHGLELALDEISYDLALQKPYTLNLRVFQSIASAPLFLYSFRFSYLNPRLPSQMGKSSKKSASKVDAVPAVVPPSKAVKKGKREAENVIEKAVNVKKQKRDEGVQQAIQKKKVEAKTQKKKEETSSSEESDLSSSDSDVKKPAPKAAKNGKGIPSSSSDSSDDDSDEKPTSKPSAPSKKSVPAKNGTAGAGVKKAAPSSSSDESDESDEEEVPKTKVTAKNGPTAAPKKKADSTDSSDESSDDDETPAKGTSQVPVATKKGPAVAAKKEDTSSSSEEESDDDEEEIVNKVSAVTPKGKEDSTDSSSEDSSEDEKVTAKGVAPTAKRAQPSKKTDESSEESDSDEDDDDEPQNKKPKVSATSKAAKPSAKAAQKDVTSESSEEDSDDDSSDEEPSKAEKVKKPSQVSKKDSSESDESSSSEEEEDEPAKTPKKKDTDVEMVDADSKSEKKAPKTPATPEATTSKTLFVGNLSFNVERADVENFFKDAGEIVDVRFTTTEDGVFRGFGHVEFATSEAAQKALELNGVELLGRGVRLDLARERGAYTPQSGKEGNSYQKGGQGQSTIFIRGFDTSQGEDEIRSSLQEFFGGCGEITRLSIPKDYETQAPKGMAYLEFQDGDSFKKALQLNQSDFGNGPLTVQEAKPRAEFGGSGRGGGGRSGGGRFGGRDSGGRFGGRDSGGRFGGRRGGGGGRGFSGGHGRGGRGGSNKPNLAAPGTGKKTTFSED